MKPSQIVYFIFVFDILGLCGIMFAGFTNQINSYTFAISAAGLVFAAVQLWIISKVIEVLEDSNETLQRIANTLDNEDKK